MERLSVIIPAYRAEKYLPQAVGSVRRQHWKGSVEILVIDDGSTDATAAVAQALGVRLLRKERGGAASARNMGLRAAAGDLILLLDADDMLTDGALEALSAPLADETIAAVFAMAEDFVSPELTEEQQAALRPRTGSYGGVLPGCSLIRRQAFEAIGLFDESLKSGETVDWQMKLRESGMGTVQLPTVTLRRRLHLANTGRLHRGSEMANYAALLRKRMKRT